MKQIFLLVFATVALQTAVVPESVIQSQSTDGSPTYLGFDRNEYPGDDQLKILRKTFSYVGFWLNHPPGEQASNWIGKRQALEAADFGFLVLFDGRLYTELKNVQNATNMGKSDAQAAIIAARREGFPAATIIFLDQEEGGRMLPEQKAYLYSWVDSITEAGFRAGIYCSGIAARENRALSVITAQDIRENADGRKIFYWITNDACPPSPGCAFLKRPAPPVDSGIPFADVWQFAQSPKRREVAARCPGYNTDGNCYPPGVDIGKRLHVDVNTARSSDPSGGRTRNSAEAKGYPGN